MSRRTSFPLILAVLFCPRACAAQDWPRWRGPEGNAVSSDSPLPVRWSTTDNVRWRVAVPGEGFSSPIVCKDRIFVTSAFERGSRRVVHCLTCKDGRILWSREIGDDDPERTSSMTGHAAATPAADGRSVVASFGNAGVVCYDYAGNRLWHRKFGQFDSELGLASSPVLYRNRVILVCDHDGDRFSSFDSFLIALDIRTGEEVWKTNRPGLYRSWSTPVLAPGDNGHPELIVNAQDHLRAYDPETGKERWRVAGMTGWVTPSPVFGHGLLFACSGKDGPTMAVRPGGMGDVTGTHVVWKESRGAPYVCSPLLYGDFLYVHTEQGVLRCYHATTGKLQYETRLKGKFIASPVAGDGKLYFTNDAGTTAVVRAGPQFELCATNALEDYCLASPAVSGCAIFVRTEHSLYCISTAVPNEECASGRSVE